MSDFVSGLRQDLVEAAARRQAAGRGARVTRPLRTRARSSVVVVGAVAALAALALLVLGLRAVNPPQPPAAPKRLGTLHIGGQPRDAVSVGRNVLVADFSRALRRITPVGEQIVSPVDGSTVPSVAADGDAVWMVRMDVPPPGPGSELVKARPDGRQLARIPLAGESGDIAVGAGGIWLQTNIAQVKAHIGGLERIDPRTHRIALTIRNVDSEGIAASAHSLWTRYAQTVTQRDENGRIVNSVNGLSPALGVEGQRTIVADAAGAWVVGQSDGLLYRIESGHVVKRLRVGELSGVIARTTSAVWVTALTGTNRYELVRVDPDEGVVTGRVAVGSEEPQTIVPVGKELWITTQQGTVVRVSQG